MNTPNYPVHPSPHFLTYGFSSLYQLSEYLAYHGIDCVVRDSYMDASLQPGEIAIDTYVDPYIIHHMLDPYWPAGVRLIVRQPIVQESENCICIGPPARDCRVHGDIHG